MSARNQARVVATACILGFSLLLIAHPVRAHIPREAMMLKRDFVAAHRSILGLGHPALLASQIEAESRWVDGLTSSANARGICQFIEPTAQASDRIYPGLAGLARYSIAWCLRAGAYLMRDEYAAFKPDRGPCSAWLLATSAYNGGRRFLLREIEQCRSDIRCDPSRWFGHVETKQARAAWAFRENRPYVARVYDREPAYAAAGFGAMVCE